MKKTLATLVFAIACTENAPVTSPTTAHSAEPLPSASASASASPSASRTPASTLHLGAARRTLAAIARSEAAAFERESPSGATHQMCPSAHAVPASLDALAPSYASKPTEWRTDAGWSCLRFEIIAPQAFQYEVASDGKSFHAFARVRDGAATVELDLAGEVNGNALVIAPDAIEHRK